MVAALVWQHPVLNKCIVQQKPAAANKTQIQSSQIKAAISVNQELLKLYWKLAGLIIEKQQSYAWGDGLIKQVSQDLRQEFPDMKGFSVTNIKYMRKWYLFYHQEKSPQAVDFLDAENIFQIPWGHNCFFTTSNCTPMW